MSDERGMERVCLKRLYENGDAAAEKEREFFEWLKTQPCDDCGVSHADCQCGAPPHQGD